MCNLASIALPKFVNKETGEFDYEELHRISKIVTRNLNQVLIGIFIRRTRRSVQTCDIDPLVSVFKVSQTCSFCVENHSVPKNQEK